MTLTIGDSSLPGVYTTQESNDSVNTNVSAPADVGIVGEADLTNGSATVNTTYSVTTAAEAARLFGVDSPLGKAVSDALSAGAYPVYAVAASETAVTNEDIFANGTSGTLLNNPVTEYTSKVVFTVDGTDVGTVTKFFGDMAGETLSSGEAIYNPATGEYKLGDTPATTCVVDYVYHDYATALDKLVADEGVRLDFIGAVPENDAVGALVKDDVNGMAAQYNFALGVAGLSYIADPSVFTNPYSGETRMQAVYPARDKDGNSLMGSYLGLRGRLGINQSGMRKVVPGVDRTVLTNDLTKAQKVDLDTANVVVLENARGKVRLLADPTCADPAVAAQDAYADAFARLVIDYVTNVVHDVSDSFIGKLHTRSARAHMHDLISEELDTLMSINSLLGYTISVTEIDAITARVEVGIETAKPLRNIEAIIVGGEVQ